MDFGEILRTIGDFGVFQKVVLFALATPHVIFPLFFSSFLFLQSDPERRCNTDWILRLDPNLTTGEQLNLTLPRQVDGTFSRCLMFVPVDWDIEDIRDRGLNETTACRDGWIYHHTLYQATIITDFDLVCHRAHLADVVPTVFMTSLLVGSYIFGPAAESFGRRRTVQVPVVLMLIFIIVSATAPNFYVYVASQFIVGAAFAGYRLNATMLATEWIGVTRRSVASCMNQVFIALGQCLLAGLVYVVRDWRTAYYVLAAGPAVTLLYAWWIPESARWLLGRGRTGEAKTLIRRVAAINKKIIPDNLLDKVEAEQEVQSGGIGAIFTSKVLLKYLFILSFAWFSLNLGFFCLTLNVGKLGLNIFLVQFVFGISEVPGHLLCVWVLEFMGRKKSLMFVLLAGSFLCLLTLAFPQNSAVAITVLVTAGKAFFNWGGSLSMVYIQELFPTSVRRTAVGLASIAFRAAGLLSPLLNMSAVYHDSLPVVVFSSLSLVSGALLVLLPETTRTELPDSAADVQGHRTVTSKEKTGSDVPVEDTKFTKL